MKVKSCRSVDDGYMIQDETGTEIMLCKDDMLTEVEEEGEPGDLVGKWALLARAE